MSCKGCIFLGTYQDMGSICDICKLQDDFVNAINACKCSADCLYKLTVEEAKELTEENEKLKAELKRLTLEYKGFEEGARTVVKFIKEATVRKMQDMLTTFFRNDETLEYSEVNADYINEQIDQIAKDLLEGNQLSPP